MPIAGRPEPKEAEKAVSMPQMPFSTVNPSSFSTCSYRAADLYSCSESSA